MAAHLSSQLNMSLSSEPAPRSPQSSFFLYPKPKPETLNPTPKNSEKKCRAPFCLKGAGLHVI